MTDDTALVPAERPGGIDAQVAKAVDLDLDTDRGEGHEH